MSLPTPGPGRPQHPSYSQPGPTITLLELAIWILTFAFIGGLWTLGEMVI